MLVDRNACDMARRSWLAAILAQYELPRPSIWIVVMTFVVSVAAATVVFENIEPIAAGETVIACSYTVNLCAPPVALPVEPPAPEPAVAQPVPEPAKPEPELEPEVKQPEPIPASVKPEPIEPPIATPAVSVAVAATEVQPSPVISNSLAKAEIPSPAAASGQTLESVESIPAAKSTEVTAASGEKTYQALTQRDDLGGHILPAYWMSVRDAVARKLVYPYHAQSRGIEGLVVINLVLDNRGRVVQAEPMANDIDEDLKKAAIKGVMRASPFNVPQLAIGETTITAQVPIQFKLVGPVN